MTRIAKAQAIANALNDRDYSARVWEGGDNIRVYVTRRLSKRTQDMGYIEICDDGDINPNGLTRAKAAIRDIAADAIMEIA